MNYTMEELVPVTARLVDAAIKANEQLRTLRRKLKG